MHFGGMTIRAAFPNAAWFAGTHWERCAAPGQRGSASGGAEVLGSTREEGGCSRKGTPQCWLAICQMAVLISRQLRSLPVSTWRSTGRFLAIHCMLSLRLSAEAYVQ